MAQSPLTATCASGWGGLDVVVSSIDAAPVAPQRGLGYIDRAKR
jgi:hypothetical protein